MHIKADLIIPEELPFGTPLCINIEHVNYGGHADNARIVGLLHEARLRYLHHHGFSEKDIGNGYGLILAELYVKYLRELFWGEELICEVGAGGWGRASFWIFYRMKKGEEVCVIAATRMVAFDFGRRRLGQLPESFVGKLRERATR